LRKTVISLWELEGSLAGRSTGLPKPFAELVISLSGTHFWRDEPESDPIIFTDGWLTPVQAAPRSAETIGRLHLVGARLHPAAAASLFGPADAKGPAYPIPLNFLLGRQGSALRQALVDADSLDQRFEAFASWLELRLDGVDDSWFPEVRDLARLNWRVDELARETGLSSRGLHKRFVHKLGLSPKLWLQLGRFDAVLRHRPATGSLADLAANFGYADQAHMTAEFRRFSGLSPLAYVQSRMNGNAPRDAPHFVPTTG